jgi:hypothetical protein
LEGKKKGNGLANRNCKLERERVHNGRKRGKKKDKKINDEKKKADQLKEMKNILRK